MMVNCCGLLTANKEPVPLKSIEVELEVRDHVATVVSTLLYENKEDKPLEAVFVFPLPGDAAVCHFSAKIGQTQIVAEVKEKQEAHEEYDDALSSGQQAFLLEESDQSPDIFSLSVGSLPPGESASIRLEYVTELAVQADDGLRFCLPAVLNPRYQPQGSENSGSSEGGSVQVTSVPASLVPYSLSFSARVFSPRPISKVESKCSLDPLQYLNTEQTQATVKLAAGHKFDRDVELLIYYKDAHQPTAVVEAGQASAKPGTLMGDPVVMLSLYPEFPQAVMSSVASHGEFVFLIDRSGSMGCCVDNSNRQETRIGSARDTLLLLLKSLPMGCYFNIYSFGSSYQHTFPKSVEYSEKTMKEALKEVEKMDADLGGTEILEPLKHIYSQSCIPSQPRQVFVFTDGEVGNTKEVINLVRDNSGSHRCFSFGIGEGASSALINGLAKEGGGHAQFITGTDRMQPKVMQSLRFALQQAVVDISVTWDLPKAVSVTVLSPPITTIFQGQRSLVYAQLTGQSPEAAEGCVTVKYSLAGHPSQNQLRFSLKPAKDTGLTVHRLGAQTLIRSLEMEERERRGQQDGRVKQKVVELSVQSGVSSSFTAFIAVNKSDSKAIQGPLLRRNVPAPMMMMMSCGMPARLQRCAAPTMKNCMMWRAMPQSLSTQSCDDYAAPVMRSRMMGRAVSQSLSTQSYDFAAPVMGSPLTGCSRSAAPPMRKCMMGRAVSQSLSTQSYDFAAPVMGSPLTGCSRSAAPPMRKFAAPQSPRSTALFSRMKQKLGGWRKKKKMSEKKYQFESSLSHRPPHTYDTGYNEAAGEIYYDSWTKQPSRDTLLKLVSLQKACGCWELEPALAASLGKTSKEVENPKPTLVSKEVWATILALIWLHGFKSDVRDEWELLAMKAVSWLRAQNAPCVTECVEAGNALLDCSVQKDALGL